MVIDSNNLFLVIMNEISYIEWDKMSDKALMGSIGKFVQGRRLEQNKSQDEVAGDAGISRSTLSLLERGENVRTDSLIRVLRVLGALDVMEAFRIKEEISPVEYAKLKKRQRRQASPRRNSENDKEGSGW